VRGKEKKPKIGGKKFRTLEEEGFISKRTTTSVKGGKEELNRPSGVMLRAGSVIQDSGSGGSTQIPSQVESALFSESFGAIRPGGKSLMKKGGGSKLTCSPGVGVRSY